MIEKSYEVKKKNGNIISLSVFWNGVFAEVFSIPYFSSSALHSFSTSAGLRS